MQRFNTRTETKNLDVQNDTGGRVAGVINTVNPLAWIIKIAKDVPLRYSETFYFYAQKGGIKCVDARVISNDCHHYEIEYLEKTLEVFKIKVKLYDWGDVWSTKATIEFSITEYAE